MRRAHHREWAGGEQLLPRCDRGRCGRSASVPLSPWLKSVSSGQSSGMLSTGDALSPALLGSALLGTLAFVVRHRPWSTSDNTSVSTQEEVTAMVANRQSRFRGWMTSLLNFVGDICAGAPSWVLAEHLAGHAVAG